MRIILRLAWIAASCALWSFAIVMLLMPAQVRPVTATHPLTVPVRVHLTAVQHPASVVTSRRVIAYDWALHQAGCWYSWGGTSCATGFDCSGLVMEAYAHAGIWLPRTTYGMLADPKLRRVWHPHAGELAFYGSGHVELYAYGSTTFGAHDYGSRVSFIREWETPAYYYIWGS